MRLLSLRKNIGKTQEEVAKELGITRATYANYEAGKTQPDFDILLKIANYFNVSLDYLCDHPYNNQVGYIPEEKKELVKKILILDEKYIDKVDGYISALLN